MINKKNIFQLEKKKRLHRFPCMLSSLISPVDGEFWKSDLGEGVVEKKEDSRGIGFILD